MNKDTLIFVTTILCLTICFVTLAAVDVSPDRLGVLRTIIDILAVVLGVSGRQVVPMIAKKINSQIKNKRK